MTARPLRVVDLFCGEGATSETGGWSSAFRARGHEVVTSDFDPKYGSDIVADIRELRASDFPWQPDIILASPPCQGFTVAQIGRNWHRAAPGADPMPKTEKAALGVELVKATLRLIKESGATFWLMENPVGMLRKHSVVGGVERRTVTYCQYGREFMKPTDLWGGFPPSLVLRPPCKRGQPCHIAAPRGSTTGTQGRPRLESTHVPFSLSEEVCVAAEQDMAAGVRYLSPFLVGASE